MFEVKGKYTNALVTIDSIDQGTMSQIIEMCNHPACTNQIAVMPDTHLGKGCVIGFTMPLGNKVVPNYVGVDIGCGMMTMYTDITPDAFDTDDKKLQFDRNVRQAVPMGFNICNDIDSSLKHGRFLKVVNDNLAKFHINYSNLGYCHEIMPLVQFMDILHFEHYLKKFGGNVERVLYGLGSLGGGNHFIEVGVSEHYGTLVFTVHTGSRNFGKQVCDYHQKKAWDIVEKKKFEDKEKFIAEIKADTTITNEEMGCMINAYDEKHQVRGITKHDAFLEELDMYWYLVDMVIAQTYAHYNRKSILDKIGGFLPSFSKVPVAPFVGSYLESVHNFIDFDDFIIRKGAIRAHDAELLILPFNSRDGILICKGKGNFDWNESAPHGAGRVLSRSEANKQIDAELAREVMSGVFATHTPSDESPLAYKSADMIERAIAPTAEIVDRIKPIINFKA